VVDPLAMMAPDPLPLDVEAVHAELAAKRRLWENDANAGDDFEVKVRGGVHTKRARGVAADCSVGQAKGDARLFCRAYGMNVMASYAYARYGEADATRLATEWCRRNQHYYDLYVGADDAAYAFTEADSGSYVEPEDFVKWADALPEGSVARERVEALRAVRPRGA
jgi:hypothetical protein